MSGILDTRIPTYCNSEIIDTSFLFYFFTIPANGLIDWISLIFHLLPFVTFEHNTKTGRCERNILQIKKSFLILSRNNLLHYASQNRKLITCLQTFNWINSSNYFQNQQTKFGKEAYKLLLREDVKNVKRLKIKSYGSVNFSVV